MAMGETRMTRRQVLKTASAATVATTAPWWLVNRSHAARAKRLVFWQIPNFTPLADQLQKEQFYEFAKQAGLKEADVEYAVVANEGMQDKLAAALEAGNPPDVLRLYESNVQYYAAQGHLLDVTDLVDRMRREPKGIFESAMTSVLYKGRAFGAPLAVNPWPVHARIDLLEQAKVDYPKTWDEFVETSKKIQSPPRLFAFGMCLGLVEDTTDNVMNLLWCYGGKMVESDNKTVVMSSPENVAGVKVIEAMFKTHKIIPPGAISWDNSGNNKAYQSRQAAFVMNPSSIYAYLDGNDKDLQKATGLFPVPAGPKGTINQIDTWAFGAFKQNPYPELARGLLDYGQLRQDRPVDGRAVGARLQAPLRQPVLEGEARLQALHPDGGDRCAGLLRRLTDAGGRRGAEHPPDPQDDPAGPRRQLAGRQGPRRVPQAGRGDLRAAPEGLSDSRHAAPGQGRGGDGRHARDRAGHRPRPRRGGRRRPRPRP
ncbi:MAG: hypothetical protein DMD79_03010 [Candidatus Rokuibacteriota bacterium]|nr:MAG: hypothetical protein DMD79_03010 [Candidatus Rokubacteria bacterium]